MFALLLAVMTAAPSSSPSSSPAPSPSASTSPLRTIVTVHNTGFCAQLATHVNSAIESTVSNDQALGTTILTLRSEDLAGNDIVRLREIHRLQDLGDSLYRNYKAGEGEVGHLRELAKSAQDDEEKKELTDAANALGGALYRQHLIQRDLDGFVSYLYTVDMLADTNAQSYREEYGIGGDIADYRNVRADSAAYVDRLNMMGPVHSYLDHSPEADAAMSLNASKDFQARVPAIVQDEMAAGEHITQIGGRC